MKRLIQHYLEMVIAMFAGMMAWGWLSAMLFGQGGAMGMHASEVIDAEQSLMSQIGGITAMDLSMIVPMVLWMRYRGHSWRHGAEMSLAMVVPTIPIHAAGFVWPEMSGAVNVASHVAMLLGMLALMLAQRAMYAGHPHGPASAHGHASAHAGKLPGSPVGR